MQQQEEIRNATTTFNAPKNYVEPTLQQQYQMFSNRSSVPIVLKDEYSNRTPTFSIPPLMKEPLIYIPSQKKIYKPLAIFELQTIRELYISKYVIPQTKDAILSFINDYKLNPTSFIILRSDQFLFDNQEQVHHSLMISIVSFLVDTYGDHLVFNPFINGTWNIIITIPIDGDFIQRISLVKQNILE